jgi:hypothetical protein
VSSVTVQAREGRQPRELPRRARYRKGKPKGKYRADYNGNTEINRHKHVLLPAIPGIKRRKFQRKYY